MKNTSFLFVSYLLLLLLCVCISEVQAVVAYPGPIEKKLPDGSYLTIRVYGDEFFGYVTTSDGYVIAQGADGYYYYADYSATGTCTVSNVRAHNPGARTTQEQMSILMRSKSMTMPVQARKVRTTNLMQLHEVEQNHFPVQGHIKTLVILAEFQDVRFSIPNPLQAFADLTNLSGYSENGAMGSVRDYYKENSGGRFDPEFVVVGPVTLDHPMAYYGAQISAIQHDANAGQMVVDACVKAKARGVDFKQFDLDHNGILDNVFIYYAGYNQAEGGPDESIWPHRSSVIYSNIFIDGIRLGGYACSSELRLASGEEMTGIGTCCHEFAHVLGLMDAYDTNYDVDGIVNELNSLSLMASGNYNNEGRTPAALTALEKQMVGWLEAEELVKDGNYTLPPIAENKAYYFETDNKGEFFILENRDKSYKWDQYIQGNGGMLIYHIDRSDQLVNGVKAKDRWLQNTLNCVEGHPCMRLIRPVNGGWNSDCFFPGTTGVTSWKVVPWSETELGKQIEGIVYDGRNVGFSYQAAGTAAVHGIVSDVLGNCIAGATLTFTLMDEGAEQENGNGTFSWVKAKNAMVQTVISDASGVYHLEGLVAGRYDVKVAKRGYALATLQQLLDIPSFQLDIELIALADAEHIKISRNAGGVDGYIRSAAGQNQFIATARWEKEDLVNYVQYMIKWVDVFVLDAASLDLVVYLDDQCVLTKSVSDFKPGQFNRVYLGEEAVRIPANKKIRVGYKATINAEHQAVLASVNYVNEQKGGDYSYNGQTWQVLSGASFLIDVWLTKPIMVTDLILDQTALTMGILDSVYLKPTILPEEATDKKIHWESSDEQVARVDAEGCVIGLAEGKVVITAMAEGGNATATCQVEVQQDYVKGVDFRIGQREIRLGWSTDQITRGWLVKWKKNKDQNFRTMELDTTFCILSQLQPDTEYDMQVVVRYAGGETGILIGKTFKTNALTSEFPLISGIKNDWKEGDLFWPVVENIQQDPRRIVWTLDQKTFGAAKDLALPAGKHELKVEVTTPDGITETLIREIIVQSKE